MLLHVFPVSFAQRQISVRSILSYWFIPKWMPSAPHLVITTSLCLFLPTQIDFTQASSSLCLFCLSVFLCGSKWCSCDGVSREEKAGLGVCASFGSLFFILYRNRFLLLWEFSQAPVFAVMNTISILSLATLTLCIGNHAELLARQLISFNKWNVEG